MNRIGILQGRLLPKNKNKLQVFPNQTWREEFEVAQEIGFSSMEWLFHARSNPILRAAGQKEMMELSAKTGVAVSSVCANHFNASNDLFYLEGPVLAKLIDACEAINCRTILLPIFDRPWVPVISKILPHMLQGHNITIGVETSLPAYRLAGLMEYIDQPNIGVYYDLGNSITFGYNAADDIRRLSKWLVGIHVKDKNRAGENVILGTGLVNFPECFQALKEINYQGDYILETCMGDNPIEVAKQHLNFVRGFLS